MTFHVSTPDTTIYNCRGVSPADAALRCCTRLASNGTIAHGEPITVRVFIGKSWDITGHKDITVTPTGQSFRPSQVAAA
jgi:hypothetical protein